MQPDGKPIGESVPIGSMYSDVATLFEVWFDPAQANWTRQRELIRRMSRPIDEARQRWPELEGKIAADIQGDGTDFTLDALATLAPRLDDQIRSQGQGSMLLGERVSETWYWALPSDKYPEGLLAIQVGTHMAKVGPLPYVARGQAGLSQPFLPLVPFPFQLVPGSAYGKTMADDVAVKCKQRNRWEALIEMIAMRMSSPTWTVPDGANVVKLTGEPGEVVRYNALGPANARPERIPGQGIPVGLLAFIERIDKEIDDIAATFEVLKGARPEGVSAGIALQILQERGMSRFGSVFVLWEHAWAEWASRGVEIFRQYATEPRMLRIMGKDGKWQVQRFMASDLQGRIDVVPEASSSMPRSTLVDRAEVEQLMAQGVLGPQYPDWATTRMKILELYGKTHWLETMAADTKNAVMENEAFDALAQHPALAQLDPGLLRQAMAMQVPFDTIADLLQQYGVKVPRVHPGYDDHQLHSREHGSDLKAEHTRALPEQVQLLKELHKIEHDRLAMMQMQAQIGLAGPGQPRTPGFLAPPGGGPPAAGPDPMTSSSSGQRLQGEFNEMSQQGAM